MLRISEKDQRDITEFQQMRPLAEAKAFGRLFRSPNLFEDAVKSILLCNCMWKGTLSMAEALCQIQPKLAAKLNSKSNKTRKVVIPHPPLLNGNKRKDDTPHSHIPNKRSKLGAMPINFPTSKELAMVDEEYLMEHCNLGHRAKTIVGLVRSIESGKLQLDEVDQQPSHEEISMQLFKVKGIGPFTSANVLMCLGFYHQIPVDSETVRLVRKVHGRELCTSKTIKNDVKEIYDKYEPFQSLAYWLELVDDYESKVGKLSELPYASYKMVNGSIDQMEMSENK